MTVRRITGLASPALLVALAVLAVGSSARAVCPGDCDGSGTVAINELVLGVNIALGAQALDACSAFDADGSGTVAINEVVQAVNAALAVCPPSASPTGTATDTPTSSATSTATDAASPTRSRTRTESPTPSSTAIAPSTATGSPTRTAAAPPPSDGNIELRIFQAEDGTRYYVIGFDADPDGLAIGAQVTSLAMSDRDPLTLTESFSGSDPILTSFSGAVPRRLPRLDQIRRTEIVIGLPSNDIVLVSPDPAEGSFDPEASGKLTLPGGRTVAADDSGSEPLYAIGSATGVGDWHVPAAISKNVSRRRPGALLQAQTIVFPAPGEPRCRNSDNPGVACDGDETCETNCSQVGQGCCGQTSDPPTCSGGTVAPIVCDPVTDDAFCSVSAGGNCRDNLGGETEGQTVTLDDELFSRVGDPASQPDSADGFFLRDRQDLIVFVVDPDAPAMNGSASGFLLAGSCFFTGAACASSPDCRIGGCDHSFASRLVVGASSRSARAVGLPADPFPGGTQSSVLDGQVFISQTNKLYYVLKANPAGAFGAQVTSIMLSSGSVENVNERLNEPVLTSFSTMLSGEILRVPPLSNIKRTALITGLVSNFIEDAGNPLNGDFDPSFDGHLTLPGGSSTVRFDGRGTEPVYAITAASGAGVTFVPAASLASTTRRFGGQNFLDVPVIVFPNPPGPIVTSDGPSCMGGPAAGEPCDPANSGTLDDNCIGGSCRAFGGEAPGQNVTLDDTFNTRVGNPDSQGLAVDGFFLPYRTTLIVFLVDLGTSTAAVGASGFAVTGTCSNADTSCTLNTHCPGGTCGEGLSSRIVVDTTRTDPDLVGIQSFGSDNNKLFVVLRSKPIAGSIGTQVTSVVFSADPAAAIQEVPINPLDTVLTSVAAARSVLDFGRIRRTAVLSGLPSNVIEDMGNPLNGDFDPIGDGLLILPGFAGQVAGDGNGTESLVDLATTSRDQRGQVTVPAATTVRTTRRLGLRAATDLTSIVFPSGFSDSPQPSKGATCVGGADAGAACDPGASGTDMDTCAPGGLCADYGGEANGQRVTLDDTIGSRVGNPGSQFGTVDGFFLRNSSDVIVFVIDLGRGLRDIYVAGSGFAVTGTCSNADVPCGTDGDCPAGTCTDGLAARNVLLPGIHAFPTPTATPTGTITVTATATATGPTPTGTATPSATGISTETATATATATPTPEPTDDAFEPDDTPAEAKPIGCGELQSHVGIDGDEDWLTFSLTATSAITIEAVPAMPTAFSVLAFGVGLVTEPPFRIERSCAAPLLAAQYNFVVTAELGNTLYTVQLTCTPCP